MGLHEFTRTDHDTAQRRRECTFKSPELCCSVSVMCKSIISPVVEHPWPDAPHSTPFGTSPGNPLNSFLGSANSCSTVCNFLATLAGAPVTTVYAGTLFVTTDPAPTVLPRPIVTPGRIMVPPPIHASSSMRTGSPYSTFLMRESTLVKCPAP
ncbi:uncharacterized protein BCR38DRAFT_105425 [Pseudomassariella vexata]|uniref:Uncharacterized protein n=1 Tax=Pseudomassariella vexata TaxID=1141098 RepID=A0A1Y2EFN1_9PEZI|nr:uncharacterized protein BCR38DRAFT_105425 [Pseudomassariella vexata]ORY70382.1 hypothetical protein BCR38DRAFT_105425 [Pseudomassariella vexata]